MGKTLERASISRQADEARKTALNLNALLDEGLDQLGKLVAKRERSGKKPLKMKNGRRLPDTTSRGASCIG